MGFSSAYRILGGNDLKAAADNAFDFLCNKVIDKDFGGLYWMLDYSGNVIDERKHVYANAFGIYGLSEYHRATGNIQALEIAKELFFDGIERYGYDSSLNIYKEEFTRDYIETSNEMLSENGIIAQATTNTHLHILEAYTNLYRVWMNQELENALIRLVNIFYVNIYKESGFLKVFYDRKYREILDIQSYGHDIEASWLLYEAINVLNLKEECYKEMVLGISDNIRSIAVHHDGSLFNECEKGIVDETRVWWVQAEAMVGFMNSYEMTEDQSYLNLVLNLWTYTKTYIVDHRDGGEWHWGIDSVGKPLDRPIVEPWKTLYHNARFCLEMIERIRKYDLTYAKK